MENNFKEKRPRIGFGNGNPNAGIGKSNQQIKEKKFPNIDIKNFKQSWVITGVDESFIEFAEKAGGYMAENGLTTSKIRNIYSEIKRIQMDFDKEKTSFYLLKPKVAYAYGRHGGVGLKTFKDIFDKCFEFVKDDKTRYNNFCNIIEAIVAYHKANGGKDN